MSNQKSDGSIWVATESFTAEVDGSQVVVQAGHTRVRDGHPLLEGRMMFFERMEPHYEYGVEQATSAPGEKRGRKPE